MPRTKPTLKQKLFAREYIKNRGNGVKAALQVYDSDYPEAKAIASQNLHKPVVQEEIKRELKKAGLDISTILTTAKDAMLSGLGVKATNSDTIAMVNTFLKLYNAFPATKHMQLSYSQKGVATSDFTQLKKQVQQQQEQLNKLMQEL